MHVAARLLLCALLLIATAPATSAVPCDEIDPGVECAACVGATAGGMDLWICALREEAAEALKPSSA